MPYLDHAGATLPSKEQIVEICKLLETVSFSNPHSHHATSRITNNIINNSRQRVLNFFSTNSDEYAVIFTHNATHSLKIVAESFNFGPKQNTSSQMAKCFYSGASFGYLMDSHNSIVGLRELVRDKVDTIVCLRDVPEDIPQISSNSLFAVTAMSNFSGHKYNLEIVRTLQAKGWSVLLDAAALVSCSKLDLSDIQPDFLVVSFYKMFGYPSGLGALLVKKDSAQYLHKHYFSGGTVASLAPETFFIVQRSKIEEKFEDGTQNFYGIAALQKGFDDIEKHGGISEIEKLTASLTREAISMLKSKFHWNGQKAVELYLENHDNFSNQGPIISFNLLNEKGEFIGYSEVSKMADLFGIELRTGCFCNIGACQKFLGLSTNELISHMESGKECGDQVDILEGKPTGAVRISFGRSSKSKDIEVLEQMIDFCFLGAQKHSSIEHPLPITSFNPTISRLFCYPIKSCRGFYTETTQFTSTGILHDRNFMIISNDITLSQKKYPQLCQLSTKMENNSLVLTSENMLNSVNIPLEMNGIIPINNIVCSDAITVEDCGKEVGNWLDSALNATDCHLRRVTHDSSRSLSNEAPYLLVNEASVLLLAEEIGLSLEEAILRFRPNIVVKGLPPFIEDQAKYVTVNNTKFRVSGKCSRCEMICVDQLTGEKNPAMIIALRSMRNRERMTFGIYLQEIGDQNEPVQVNDSIFFE